MFYELGATPHGLPHDDELLIGLEGAAAHNG